MIGRSRVLIAGCRRLIGPFPAVIDALQPLSAPSTPLIDAL
jgi:hypothetical protein